MTRTKAAVASIAIIILAALACFNLYFVNITNGGTILWNREEAICFMYTGRNGLTVSYLRYPWFYFKEMMHMVEDVDDERQTLVVTRATSSGVERHTLELKPDPKSRPERWTPIDGNIYAYYPPLGGLCKWSHDHLERGTPEEIQKYGEVLTDNEISDETGWSRHRVGVAFGPRSLVVGDRFRLVETRSVDSHRWSSTVDLIRPSGSSERIVDAHDFDGWVSRSEYLRALPKR